MGRCKGRTKEKQPSVGETQVGTWGVASGYQGAGSRRGRGWVRATHIDDVSWCPGVQREEWHKPVETKVGRAKMVDDVKAVGHVGYFMAVEHAACDSVHKGDLDVGVAHQDLLGLHDGWRAQQLLDARGDAGGVEQRGKEKLGIHGAHHLVEHIDNARTILWPKAVEAQHLVADNNCELSRNGNIRTGVP